MEGYVANRTCACVRCKWNGLMGPALLVTIGSLLLLENLGAGDFERTWPAILIVIGSVKLMQTIGSVVGHRLTGAEVAAPAAPLAAQGAEVSHE